MEEAQIVRDVEASMQRELDKLWGNTNEAENFTIFRTPHNIFQSKKNLFEPSVISIGPFHRGQEHLRALEEQKWQFLRDFLSRGDHISLNLCISEMKSLEERTRRCYSEKFDDLKSKAFVEMMLLDGCFVLEYNLKYLLGNADSVFEVGWNHNFIDLTNNDLDSINSIIPDPPVEIHHLLHLCYHYVVTNPEKPVVLSPKPFDLTRIFNANRSPHSTFGSSSVPLPNSTENISSMVIPCATELKQKGLKFTPQRNPRQMLDISFEYGVLKIPQLKINDDTKPIFANLIAFEHSKYGKENKPFTRFVAFLNDLVNTPNDMTILQECGIVENWLGSKEELAHFLNQVIEGTIFVSDHYLVELYKEVNRYSESSWNKERAKLIRDYFSSPWSTISFIAAFILLVLTLVQSFFAAFTYFRPSSP